MRKTFKEFLEEEMGAIAANSTANVEGMRTEPVVRTSRMTKLLRRVKPLPPKKTHA
jgi:hypothetical protein